MITDQPNTGDGDIRQGGGGNPPPHVSGHNPAEPRKLSREARLILHVDLAVRSGLTTEDALDGLGVTPRQLAAWRKGKPGDEAYEEQKRRKAKKLAGGAR